jgi:hypothetical protein
LFTRREVNKAIADSEIARAVAQNARRANNAKAWVCPLCTFRNELNAQECAMCGTPRPASVITRKEMIAALGLRNENLAGVPNAALREMIGGATRKKKRRSK